MVFFKRPFPPSFLKKSRRKRFFQNLEKGATWRLFPNFWKNWIFAREARFFPIFSRKFSWKMPLPRTISENFRKFQKFSWVFPEIGVFPRDFWNLRKFLKFSEKFPRNFLEKGRHSPFSRNAWKFQIPPFSRTFLKFQKSCGVAPI